MTLLLAGLIARRDVVVNGCKPKDMACALQLLTKLGAELELRRPDQVRVIGSNWRPKRPLVAVAQPHPGLPTDLLPLLASDRPQDVAKKLAMHRGYPMLSMMSFVDPVLRRVIGDMQVDIAAQLLARGAPGLVMTTDHGDPKIHKAVRGLEEAVLEEGGRVSWVDSVHASTHPDAASANA